MSEQPTGRQATISEQLPAIETFLYLARSFPHLPSAYLTAHAFHGLGVQLLVEMGADVEAWRVALQVPADGVTLHRYDSYTSIEFDTVVRGVLVKVYGQTPLLPERARLAPAQDAERRYRAAQLAEQHHQADDPAEPDPAAYIAVPAVAVSAEAGAR